MEGKQTIHARAAPLLSSSATSGAGPGIARIRQAWLPVSAYAPAPGARLAQSRALIVVMVGCPHGVQGGKVAVPHPPPATR